MTGGKVFGANLTSKPGFAREADYWIEWDWGGWIRPQIDAAKALGCNAVRIIGDVGMIARSELSQEVYSARTQQFVGYCVDNGLKVYYTGCATYGTAGADNGTVALPDSTIASVIVSNIGSITSGDHDYTCSIIGCDIVQEANANLTAQRVNAIYALVRPQVPASIGCTFSTFGAMPDSGWINQIIGSCDYLDYHLYPNRYNVNAPPTWATVLAGPLTVYPTKKVMFGEVGASRSQYSAAQVSSFLSAAAAIGLEPDDRVMGVMMWAVQDQDEPYGAFTCDWLPRPEIAGPWIRAGWMPYLPTIQPPPAASPSGTLVPPAASIVDSSLAVWTLGAPTQYGRQALRNGQSAAGGQGDVLSWRNGQIKAHNTLGDWWLWTGSGWTKTVAP